MFCPCADSAPIQRKRRGQWERHMEAPCMNELEQIISRKRARKRILWFIISTTAVFIVSLLYFLVILAAASLNGGSVDFSEWNNIILASALIITAPFMVLWAYDWATAHREDRILIGYYKDRPDLKEEVDKIEDEYRVKKSKEKMP